VAGFIPYWLCACDVALLRHSPGGEKLSFEMLLILTLVVYDGYELFPAGHGRLPLLPTLRP